MRPKTINYADRQAGKGMPRREAHSVYGLAQSPNGKDVGTEINGRAPVMGR